MVGEKNGLGEYMGGCGYLASLLFLFYKFVRSDL